MDHDSTHPTERMPKNKVPARVLMPVARQQKVVHKTKVLQTVCDGSEELLQKWALRFSEVRASIWHTGNRLIGSLVMTGSYLPLGTAGMVHNLMLRPHP